LPSLIEFSVTDGRHGKALTERFKMRLISSVPRKTILLAVGLLVSVQSFATQPHSFEVAPKLLSDNTVRGEIAKYPNYYFESLRFEESDDNWTEHTFTLVLAIFDGEGPDRICFWVDYDEKSFPHVTRVSKFEESCK